MTSSLENSGDPGNPTDDTSGDDLVIADEPSATGAEQTTGVQEEPGTGDAEEGDAEEGDAEEGDAEDKNDDYVVDAIPEVAVLSGVKIGGADYRIGSPVPPVVKNSQQFQIIGKERRAVKDAKGQQRLDADGKPMTVEVEVSKDPSSFPFVVQYIHRYGPKLNSGSTEGFVRIVCAPSQNSVYARGPALDENGNKILRGGKEVIRPGTYLVIDEPMSAGRLERLMYMMTDGQAEILLAEMNHKWVFERLLGSNPEIMLQLISRSESLEHLTPIYQAILDEINASKAN